MKGASLNKLRGAKLSISFIALICTSLLIWAWEPLLASVLPLSDHFDVRLGNFYPGQQQPTEDDFLKAERHAVPVTEGMQYIGENADANMAHDLVNELSEHGISPPSGTLRLKSGTDPDGDRHSDAASDKKKDCNYARGKWAVDKRRPLYSGFGCKQWLSEMWACRLTKRTDFSFEAYRWLPENCEMPEFEGSAFLKRMRHKTLAFVGDSLGRQQFQSMMCMITGGRETSDVEDVGRSYGLVKARGAVRPDGWAYRFPRTNTTILYYWSASLCELEPLNRSDADTHYAMHLDRPAFFLKHFLHRFNVLVLNTGHHWNRGKLRANKWEMYVGGKPVVDRKLAQIANARNFTVYSVVKWLDSQLPLHPGLKGFYRSISPRHFVNGDWNTGGSCDHTTPLGGGSEVTQVHSSDTVAEGAVMRTKVKLLDITALSQLRDECHISKYSVKASTGAHDCLHWCLPGVPDAWNELLYAQI
ncbi:protein trichome birefringence-like 14 isoform X1 [Phalaenopsis equestris]|uniref:protein trichome birefringence-like 14 isoform X1 n=2 Tax=Phalaenopsis equestris TaxID=78828 RepID=UPI0009E1EA04|nr:protein trichome birefringence-like 14 isoform X1 [Phalaenopsis equestris]